MKKILVFLLSIMMLVSLAGCTSSGTEKAKKTEVKDSEEWSKLFDRFDNVTVRCEDEEFEATIKVDGKNIEYKNSENETRYYTEEKGMLFIINDEDGEFVNRGYSYSFSAGDFVNYWFDFEDYRDFFEDYTYDKETKTYLFNDGDSYSEAVRVEDGKIVYFEFADGEGVTKIYFSDYGTTSVTLPDYRSTVPTVSKEEFDAAFAGVHNVTVERYEEVGDLSYFGMYRFDGNNVEVLKYDPETETYPSEYVKEGNGTLLSYYTEDDENYTTTDVTAHYVDALLDKAFTNIPTDYDLYSFDEQNECYYYDDGVNEYLLFFEDGELALYKIFTDDTTVEAYVYDMGMTVVDNSWLD